MLTYHLGRDLKIGFSPKLHPKSEISLSILKIIQQHDE